MTLKVLSRQITAKELALGENFSFSDLLGSNSAAFIHNHQGLIGWGEAHRLEATGPNRILELDKAWRELVAQSEIHDELNLPGTGLISFGSIAFANQSETKSVLVIPNVIIGLQDGILWLTTVNLTEAEALEM